MAEAASGATDASVLELAQAESRLLLTEDKGFGDLVFRSKRAEPGVVLLRVDPARHSLKWDRLQAAIASLGSGAGCSGTIWSSRKPASDHVRF
jgi:predicted nuclease of predicted toxin-antitoxin system